MRPKASSRTKYRHSAYPKPDHTDFVGGGDVGKEASDSTQSAIYGDKRPGFEGTKKRAQPFYVT